MRYLCDMLWKFSCVCSYFLMVLFVVVIVGGCFRVIDQEVFIVVFVNLFLRFIGMGSVINGMVECSLQFRVNF